MPSIGTWLRTMVRMLPLEDLRRVRIILDLHETDLEHAAHDFHQVVRTSQGSVLLLPVMLLLPFEPTTEVAALFTIPGPCIPPDFLLGQRDSFQLSTAPFAPATPGDGKGCAQDFQVKADALQGFCPEKHHLKISVIGDMCTLLLMPVLFQLAHSLTLHGPDFPVLPAVVSASLEGSDVEPTYMVCCEKVPNLIRTVLLFQSHNLLPRLVVCTHGWLVCKYCEEVAKLRVKLQDGTSKSCTDVSVISVDDAVVLVEAKRESQQVVLIDLGESAVTLHCGTSVPALRSGCVIWGFEMKGIPDAITELGSMCVQLPSRRSINLVASVAIALHCIQHMPT